MGTTVIPALWRWSKEDSGGLLVSKCCEMFVHCVKVHAVTDIIKKLNGQQLGRR